MGVGIDGSDFVPVPSAVFVHECVPMLGISQRLVFVGYDFIAYFGAFTASVGICYDFINDTFISVYNLFRR